jgi:hypothetical protein
MSSVGQTLYRQRNVSQSICISASCFSDDTRLGWTESFSKSRYRGKSSKVKATSMLLVLSQNCDIAARDDRLDDSLELVVCKEISTPHEGNKFAHSARKLHFQVDEQWYEANVDYILTVCKQELLEAIEQSTEFEVKQLPKIYEVSVPIWRANRYLRTGLPDSFNAQLFQIWDEYVALLEAAANCADEEYSSYIRALYVRVEPMTESRFHSFELFALLRHSIDNENMSAVQNIMESWAEALESKSGFTDISEIYADRESNTFVSYLNGLLRLNLDHLSLSQGDDDVGPSGT